MTDATATSSPPVGLSADLPTLAGVTRPPEAEATEARSGTAPPLSTRIRQRSAHWAVRALALVTALLVWHLLTENNLVLWLRFDKIPGPVDTLTAFWTELTSGELVSHMHKSTWRIAQGFGLAAVVGITTGVAIGRSKWAYDLMSPVLEMLRPIPAIAWVPMAILLFPDNEQSIIFICFLAALFPVVVATRHAVGALPIVWEDAVRTMGASRRAVLWRVVLPGTLPGIFSGLSVAMGVAWICVISAEMISGQLGIGYYTQMQNRLINYPEVAAGMLTIGFLGLMSAGLIELVGRWFTRWLPRSEAQT